jgi:thioredoxin 1
MAQTKVTTENFSAEVLEHSTPVLVDFWAVWCGPCQMVNPTLEALSTEYEGKLKIAKLNVDENAELASKYGVMSIPTFIVFNKGQKVGSFVGAMPKEMFVQHIDEILAQIKKG